MATENVNQSGASTAADSAKEETAAAEHATGPDSAAVEPQAAADINPTAQSNESAAATARSSEQPSTPEEATASSPEQPSTEQQSDGEQSGARHESLCPHGSFSFVVAGEHPFRVSIGEA